MIKMLDREITQRFVNGTEDLLPGDRYHLQHNLLLLLKKPVPYKQSWLLNIIAATDRRRRQLQMDAKALKHSQSTSWLLQWIKRTPP